MVQGWSGNEGGILPRIKWIVKKLTSGWQLEKERIIRWFALFMVFLAILNFLSCGFFFEGLQHASVAELQALIQLTPAFTMMMSFIFLHEKVSLMNLAAVFISLLGVAVFTWSVTNGSTADLDGWGITLGIATALGYASYGVIVTKVFSDSFDFDASVVTLFFVGLATVFPVSFFIVLDHYSGFEIFALPGSWPLFGLLCLNAFLSVCANTFYLGGIALIGPTPTNIIAISQIAVASVADYFLDGKTLTLEEWVGCGCIVVGFFFTTIDRLLVVDTELKDGSSQPLLHSIQLTPAGNTLKFVTRS